MPVPATQETSNDEPNAALADFTDERLDRTIHFGGDAKRAPCDVPPHPPEADWHTEDARRALGGEPEQPFGDEAFAKSLQHRRSNGAP